MAVAAAEMPAVVAAPPEAIPTAALGAVRSRSQAVIADDLVGFKPYFSIAVMTKRNSLNV